MSSGSDSATAGERLDRATVQAALAVAVRAPSIHNTQPWRWALDDGGLVLRADRSRQLAVADPDGHSLMVSCGAALHLTDVALRAAGRQIRTTLAPDPADADALARFTPAGRTEPDEQTLAQAEAALRRRSDRRPFAATEVSADDVEALRHAGSDADVWLDFPVRSDQRVELAVAVSWADRVERNDQAYIAEQARWVHDPEVNALSDGVPVDVVPHVSAEHPRHTDVPLRDFELGLSGRQIIERDVDERPLIGVLFTNSDTAQEQLLAGRAMMRLMLQAELMGLSTCALSQAVDLAAFRTRMQQMMGWVGYPQMMVRIGHPTSPTGELPRTPRRDPAAVLDVAGESG